MLKHTLPLLALVLATGCITDGNAATPGLAGSEWTFISIDGDDPVAAETSLTFRNGALGANVGCNGMGGEWRIEDRRLIAGPLIGTQMYCDEPIMAQERAVSTLLASAPEVTVEGDQLTLASANRRAILQRTGS